MNPSVQLPIPRDLTLPLPVNSYLLEVLLIFAFVAHILFVNLLLGGSILTLFLQARGYDKAARLLASTVTIHKSMAVVLGVAPLLIIGVLYTIHFFTANTLTGNAWISVIPLLSIAFLLLYFHQYSWDFWAERQLKSVHMLIQGIAVAILLFIPLVFITNITVMMLPEYWTQIHGFASALSLPSIWPRYFHVISATLATSGIFGVWYFGRPQTDLPDAEKPHMRRLMMGIAFIVSLAQFLIGPALLLSMPAKGLSDGFYLAILGGTGIALFALWNMWQALRSEQITGKQLGNIILFLTLTVVSMAFGRHMYRGVALQDHREQIAARTEKWIDDAAQARYDAEQAALAENDDKNQPASHGGKSINKAGEKVFKTVCSSCHAVDKPLVGPSVTEIAKIYANNPAGIAAWAKAPGQKRAGLVMPSFAHLGDQALQDVGEYMLQIGAPAEQKAGESAQ